jgi:hypothetical protein
VTKTTTTTGKWMTPHSRMRTVVSGLILGTMAASGCFGEQGTVTDGGASVAHDAARGTPDARTTADASAERATVDAGMQPPPNSACTAGSQCATGYCADGVCCDTACDQPCQSCALAGTVGTCSPLRNANDDRCADRLTCSGSGACLKALGQECNASTDCGSGNCVDKVCCSSAACGTCQSCAILGSVGTCTPMGVGQPSDDCPSTQLCDGQGHCLSSLGIACTADKDCVSGHCSDGVCCDEACTNTCYSCRTRYNLAGLCGPIPGEQDPFAVTTCTGTNVCEIAADGIPFCKPMVGIGEPCKYHGECVNGWCGTWYPDGDGDGFGANSTSVRLCGGSALPGYSDNYYDCCDADTSTHPGQTTFSTTPDRCGRIDRNCDGIAEAAVPPASGWR